MENNLSGKNKIQNSVRIGMTVDEAAAYTGIGRNTLRQLIHCGKLPVLRVGRKTIIRTDILEQFLEINQGINLLDFQQVKKV